MVGGAPRQKRWSPRLFGCCDDIKLCCPVAWCECIAAAQLYQRVFGFGCAPIAIILWGALGSAALWLAACYLSYYNYFAFDVMSITNPFTDAQYFTMMFLFAALGFACALLSIAYGGVLLCRIRRRIRTRDRLQTDVRGLDDCCVPFWCGPWAIVQMLRHDGATGSTYSLCHPTAGPLPAPTRRAARRQLAERKWSKRALCVGAVAVGLSVALAAAAFTTMATTAVVLDLSRVHNTSNARMRPMGTAEARRRRLLYRGEMSYDAVAASLVDSAERNIATVECAEPDDLLEQFEILHVYGRGYPELQGIKSYRLGLYDHDTPTPYGIDTLAPSHSNSLNIRDTLGCRLSVNLSAPLPRPANLTEALLRLPSVQEYHIDCPSPTHCFVLFGSEDAADAAIGELQAALAVDATFVKDVRRVRFYPSPGNVLLGCTDAADYIKRGKYTCGIATLSVSYDFTPAARGASSKVRTHFPGYWLYPSISRFLLSGLPYGHIEGWYRDAITNRENGKTCDVRIDWLIDFDDTDPQNASNTYQEVIEIEEQPQPSHEREPGGRLAGTIPYPQRDVEGYVLDFPGWKLSPIIDGWLGPFWKETCHTFGPKTRYASRNEWSLRCTGYCRQDDRHCPVDRFAPFDRANSTARYEQCPTCRLTAADLYRDGVDGSKNREWVDPCVQAGSHDGRSSPDAYHRLADQLGQDPKRYWTCENGRA